MTDPIDIAELRRLIQSYLGNGGLFNPECMQHDLVRDMILKVPALLDEIEQRRRTSQYWKDNSIAASDDAIESERRAAEYRETLDSLADILGLPTGYQHEALLDEVERLRELLEESKEFVAQVVQENKSKWGERLQHKQEPARECLEKIIAALPQPSAAPESASSSHSARQSAPASPDRPGSGNTTQSAQ